MPGKRQTETGVPIMLTPQEVSEHAFAKASFGGYNMAMVDEFLDQLTEDYTAIYKENAVLKPRTPGARPCSPPRRSPTRG